MTQKSLWPFSTLSAWILTLTPKTPILTVQSLKLDGLSSIVDSRLVELGNLLVGDDSLVVRLGKVSVAQLGRSTDEGGGLASEDLVRLGLIVRLTTTFK